MEEYIIANCTDTGKVRSVNEDSMSTFDSPNGRVVVVCDGMGGQNAGDVASQLAVTVIQDILTDNRFNSPEEAITKSIIAANQAILVRASQNASLSGMGATCVMLIISDGRVYYGSVGDSRIYLVSEGMIRQLTKDQSYVQTLVDAGELTQEAAEHHRDKNQITNALGIEGMTPPVVCQIPITPTPGSIFLLCSDGLSGMVNNSVINQVISDQSHTLQEKAQELVKLANNAGGIDNITVQLVEFPKNIKGAVPTPAPNKSVKKSSTRKAVLYWMITIICIICAIGGVTYWVISKEDSKSKTSTTIKSQANEKNTNKSGTKQVNSPSQSGTSPQPIEPKVTVIETKRTEKPQTGTNPKNKAVGKVKELKENTPEPSTDPKTEDEVVKIITKDFSEEK